MMFRTCAAAAVAIAALAACAIPTAAPEDVEASSQAWDSEEGNPTESTHSYLTNWAVDAVRSGNPEVQEYRKQIVDGANTELHELPVENAQEEALRREIRGTNWACDRPDLLWQKAKERYRAGDRAKAYWYVGVILHHVEDMGVPAHAFHVVHQGNLREGDNFERLVLLHWEPETGAPPRTDPRLATPDRYVEWSAGWTADDFHEAYPGDRYTTDFFRRTWLFARGHEKRFARHRQGRTAYVTSWALRRAAQLLAAER